MLMFSLLLEDETDVFLLLKNRMVSFSLLICISYIYIFLTMSGFFSHGERKHSCLYSSLCCILTTLKYKFKTNNWLVLFDGKPDLVSDEW